MTLVPPKKPRKPRQKRVPKPPDLPAIEIHLMETRIDNPTVPIRWCYPAELFNRMQAGRAQGHAYAVLMVLRHTEDLHGHTEVRELKDAGLAPFTFANFSRPGKWNVSFALFERTEIDPEVGSSKQHLEGKIARHWLSYSGRPRTYDYSLNLDTFKQHSYGKDHRIYAGNSHGDRWPGSGEVITLGSLIVEVPEGIFAKEPAPWRRAFANYFYPNTPPYDQCDFRNRFYITMIFPKFGFVPYLIWELLKRLGQFALGLIALLAWRKNSWWFLVRTFEPAIKFSINDDLERPVQDDGVWPLHQSPKLVWASPGAIILYIIGSIVLWFACKIVVFPVLVFLAALIAAFWIPIVVIAVIIALVVVVGANWDDIDNWVYHTLNSSKRSHNKRVKREQKEKERKEAILAEAQYEASVVSNHAALLMCGIPTAQQVTLEAIPPEFQQKDMNWFTFLKRKYCRPYAYRTPH